MKQNFDSQELIKYLKKGELIRNDLEKEDIESEILNLEQQILNESFEFDFKFISLAFLAKFLVWPLFMLGLIFLDSRFFGLFSPLLHKIMFLISIVPIAANTVAYAALLKTHPQKAAVAVLLSTLFALVYIPVLAIYFI